jgi:hypothetical protein
MNRKGMEENRLYDTIKKGFARIIKENGLGSEAVVIHAAALSPEEAIGTPVDRDYPLVAGRERLMQAEFRGSLGQAFTDMYGDFSGRLSDIVAMELRNNFQRAIFISSLNVVMRYLGLITKTVHCKDNEPPECSHELVKYIEKTYDHPRIAFVGFQPRMVQALAPRFDLRVTDLDRDNIGREKFGVTIDGPEKTQENFDWCDLALVTGTTAVNDTLGRFVVPKPVVFYGITISGVASLLGLNHFCHCGH